MTVVTEKYNDDDHNNDEQTREQEMKYKDR